MRSYLRLLAASRVQWLHAIVWCITPEDKVSAVQYSAEQYSMPSSLSLADFCQEFIQYYIDEKQREIIFE